MMRGVMPDEAGNYHASELIGFSEMEKEFGIEICNYAMPTFTTERVLDWAQSTMERVAAPDFVIIECGGNDCDYDWKTLVESEGKVIRHRRSLEQFKKDYENLIRFFHGMRIPVIAAITPHISTPKYLLHLQNVDERIKNLGEFLPTVKQMRMEYKTYEDQMYAIAKQYKCDIIELQEYFEPLERPEEFFSSDGMHPNEKGYALIGNSFKKYFQAHC